MKRIISILYSVFVGLLCVSFVFAGGIPGTFPNMPPRAPWEKHGLIFNYDPSRNISKDLVSRTALTQTYTGTNHTRINSAGLLETVAANTPVIDHIGISLTPALRTGPQAANLLLSDRTFTVVGGWTLANATTVKNVTGVDGVANSGTTFTATAANGYVYIPSAVLKGSGGATFSIYMKRISGAGTIAISADDNVNSTQVQTLINSTTWTRVSVTKAAAAAYGVYIRIVTSGDAIGIDCGQYENKLFPSSYFAGAAAIGSELIAAQVDRDFSGASNWANVDINAYDETGDLTITASASGQYCQLPEANAPMTAGKVYRIQFAVANYVGGWTIGDFDGNTIGTVGVNGTYYMYWICTNTGGGLRITSTAVNSSGDFDNFSIKEHGTVRLGEGGTVTMAFDANQTSALTGTTGQGALVWIPPVSKGALSANHNVFAWNTGATNGIYLASADGTITMSDGTLTATTAYSYVAGTPCIITWYWAGGKMRIGACAVGGSSLTWSVAESNYDGSFNPGANAVFGAGTLVVPNRYTKIEIWNVRQNDNSILTLR